MVYKSRGFFEPLTVTLSIFRQIFFMKSLNKLYISPENNISVPYIEFAVSKRAAILTLGLK